MFLKKILKNILDLLFPIRCLGCQKYDSYLCDDCFKKIKVLENNLIEKNSENIFLDKLLSASHYKDSLLQKIIPTFKYKFATDLAEPLSQLLIQALEKYDFDKNAILIPVPLYKKRLKKRGFNQAKILADKVGKHFDLELKNKLIKRIKDTGHQAALNKEGRLHNLDMAFICRDKKFVKDKNFILIDDVSTTGITLNKIAKILKDNQAQEVWGLVIAHE